MKQQLQHQAGAQLLNIKHINTNAINKKHIKNKTKSLSKHINKSTIYIRLFKLLHLEPFDFIYGQ